MLIVKKFSKCRENGIACLRKGKLRRRLQRERHQTKGLMNKTIAVRVRFESLYISLPSSAKQQREMTTSFMYFGEREPHGLIFGIFFRN